MFLYPCAKDKPAILNHGRDPKDSAIAQRIVVTGYVGSQIDLSSRCAGARKGS